MTLLHTDINECQQMNSTCDQLCTNTEGSFVCSCEEGYELQNDRKSCEGIAINKY